MQDQKLRGGVRQTKPDPFFEYFKDKKIKQTITVKITSTDTKGLIVRPEGTNLDFPIKKTNIAINAQDARSSRFINGDRIDLNINISESDKFYVEKINIIGGEYIYKEFLPLATKLLITEIDIEVISPDAFFPEWDRSQWKEISRKRSSENRLNFSFVEYQRY